MLGLDEHPEGDLLDELRTRREARARGACDYCGGSDRAKLCKFPSRHAQAQASPKKLPAEERMTLLAESFPALQRAPGVRPWRAGDLDGWSSVCSSGELHAVRFVLHVWNSHHEWDCGPFEVVKAYQVWDEGNRAAFARWVEDPWTA